MRLFIPLFFALSACATNSLTELPSRNDPLPDILPPMKVFSQGTTQNVAAHANSDLARDFLELAFEMESGRKLDRLSRFEGPITVAFAGEKPSQFSSDLDDLLARLKHEAGLNIRRIENHGEANIVVQTLPRKRLQSLVPHAACFVVPRVRNWAEFKKSRRSGALDWTTLEIRERATVFIPDDVSPQEARDCLHEEIAQSLGPLNDIYRLPDSVFNDDNINTVLTDFDMLMLRIYYDHHIKNGMTKQQVAEILPGILKRLNASGETVTSDGIERTPRPWIDSVETALGPRVVQSRRLSSIRKAVYIAEKNGWQDNRLGFSLFAQGKLSLGTDGETSVDSFTRAYQLYVEIYGKDNIHTAHVALQLAAFSLSTGDADTALNYINSSLPSVTRAKNATLLATFLMIKAEVLDFQGQNTDAALVRLDGLGWARYGFANVSEIRSRMKEIAALRPRNSQAGS